VEVFSINEIVIPLIMVYNHNYKKLNRRELVLQAERKV